MDDTFWPSYEENAAPASGTVGLEPALVSWAGRDAENAESKQNDRTALWTFKGKRNWRNFTPAWLVVDMAAEKQALRNPTSGVMRWGRAWVDPGVFAEKVKMIGSVLLARPSYRQYDASISGYELAQEGLSRSRSPTSIRN